VRCALVDAWRPKNFNAPLAEWLAAPISTAVAIVGAASGGDQSAAGGLFGIGQSSSHDLNARTTDEVLRAAEVYKSGGWAAFPAYRSGAYIVWKPWAVTGVTAYKERGTQPPGVAEGNPVATSVYNAENTVVDTATGVGQLLGFLTQPGSWVRILKVLAGLGLVVVGAAVFVKAPKSPPGGMP
jgi:hypothetical protein